MTRLLWGQVGSRKFDVGVDQAALYLQNGSVVPWTGIISIEENFGDSTTNPIYYDGVKTRDTQTPGDFSASLKALTYPHELLDLIGVKEINAGLFVDGQQPKVFNMCYRTLIGNDTLGVSYGYKLHLLYNLTAITDSVTYATLTTEVVPSEIGIQLYGVPDKAPNYRPTAHVILDSTQIDSKVLLAIENILFGQDVEEIFIDGNEVSISTDILDGGSSGSSGVQIVDGNDQSYTSDVDPRFPSIEEMIQLVLFFDPKRIIPHPDTGISDLVDGYGDLTQTKTQGVYFGLPENRLIPSNWEGYYWLEKPPDPTTDFWFDFEGGIPGTFVKTTDVYGVPFSTVSAGVVPYASPGKNSNTGITIHAGADTGLLQWNNLTPVDKLAIGFWFKPAIIPNVDARIFDIRETSTANTVGGLLYTSTTPRFRIMQGTSGLTTGQSGILPAGVWYWVTMSWNATTKIAKFKIYDTDGVLLHDSGAVALTTAYTAMTTTRFIRPASYDIGASSWDMLQYQPGSDVLLNPWMI